MSREIEPKVKDNAMVSANIVMYFNNCSLCLSTKIYWLTHTNTHTPIITLHHILSKLDMCMK